MLIASALGAECHLHPGRARAQLLFEPVALDPQCQVFVILAPAGQLQQTLPALIDEDEVRDGRHGWAQVLEQAQPAQGEDPSVALYAETVALEAAVQSVVPLIHVDVNIPGELPQRGRKRQTTDSRAKDGDSHGLSRPFLVTVEGPEGPAASCGASLLGQSSFSPHNGRQGTRRGGGPSRRRNALVILVDVVHAGN